MEKPTRRAGGLLAALSIVVTSCSVRHGMPGDGSRVDDLPAEIHRVESFGLWRHGERAGRQRIVVTRSCRPAPCSDRLWLQWLENHDDAQGRYAATEEVATVDIVELGTHASVERILPSPSVSEPARFQLDVADTETGGLRTVCIVPGDPGSYEVARAACASLD